ncbi:unnamed protein product [Dibothriocephalus latus]|uniref:Uncharacterized protein n=1 Tax=Dibothriocephalus latus TaxID=60516 RepID=A0A3P7NT85_DIBLA|nr:unnamed protein product [Dibothriocephalus latus]
MGSSLAAATGPSLRPLTASGTSSSAVVGGLRALRNKDAVFRATTATCSNLPASRRRVFHSQALPPPSELLNARGRLSVSDAVPHFSPLAVGTSATGIRASRMDTISMDAATSRRALTSEAGDMTSPVSPSSSSLLIDSGVMAPATSAAAADASLHSNNTDSDHRSQTACEDASNRGTAEINLSSDLSFWGPDLVGFLCGSDSLGDSATNECNQGMKPLLAPLVSSPFLVVLSTL